MPIDALTSSVTLKPLYFSSLFNVFNLSTGVLSNQFNTSSLAQAQKVCLNEERETFDLIKTSLQLNDDQVSLFSDFAEVKHQFIQLEFVVMKQLSRSIVETKLNEQLMITMLANCKMQFNNLFKQAIRQFNLMFLSLNDQQQHEIVNFKPFSIMLNSKQYIPSLKESIKSEYHALNQSIEFFSRILNMPEESLAPLKQIIKIKIDVVKLKLKLFGGLESMITASYYDQFNIYSLVDEGFQEILMETNKAGVALLSFAQLLNEQHIVHAQKEGYFFG